MKILVTGANGYIARRLIPALLAAGHTLVCCVRDRTRFAYRDPAAAIEIVEIDFEAPAAGVSLPQDIEAAYFLMHSMNAASGDFQKREVNVAQQFLRLVVSTACRQVIYLGGIVNDNNLSRHLASRLAVENALSAGGIPLTVLRAGIVVGSGSASFEIIRDLVEKLPIMIAPRWLATRSQPIAVRNVVEFLVRVLMWEGGFHENYDIGGPEVLTYKQMLLQYAEVRHLKRFIVTVPVMTPRLSSYWLYFITSTSYTLAANLVDSMKVEIICRPNDLTERLGITLIPYRKAVQIALERAEQRTVMSGWRDSFVSSGAPLGIMRHVAVPSTGAYKDVRERTTNEDPEAVWRRVWAIGGETGYYYGRVLWTARGLIDKAVGGVGLNRGRTAGQDLNPGDAVDFWRVIAADKEHKRLLLFAEMKMPGEAWLEFSLVASGNEWRLIQIATFVPRGIFGRLYWYLLLPFHHFIFRGMIDGIAQGDTSSY